MKRFILGIDEVGRGCLAGPIVVAALALPVKLKIKNEKVKSLELRDSKKLSAKQREEWLRWIKANPKIFYAKASVYPKMIDRINISQAANLAATRAFRRVCELISYDLRSTVDELRGIRVYLDGGLYLNRARNSPTHQLKNCRTVIRGDEKFNSIKLASIVAKVSRDHVMKRNHRKFPQYGFDQHVGYGTKIHMTAIKKHGYCELHRLSFLKNFVKSV